MRFAWLKENAADRTPVQQEPPDSLMWLTVAYNVVWWVPIVLPFTKLISYRTGSMAFLVITIVRAIANLVRNNLLSPEKGARFPLRAP
jgi:hypothetical protein